MRGRPLNWQNPEDFERAVEEYFDTDKEPTWTGLAIHLGFESRQSLWEYSKKDGFSLPVKKALQRIENKYEKAILKGNPAGAIFALKNFGWKDRQEVEQSGGTSITVKWDQSLIPSSHTESPQQE